MTFFGRLVSLTSKTRIRVVVHIVAITVTERPVSGNQLARRNVRNGHGADDVGNYPYVCFGVSDGHTYSLQNMGGIIWLSIFG